MVAVACRRLAQAARWNGQAPQTTTGAASASEIHCQYVNCSAGTIAMRDHRHGQDGGADQALAQRPGRVGLRIAGGRR